jgi:pimeloyl-ACP methyl ester carboxylesterase
MRIAIPLVVLVVACGENRPAPHAAPPETAAVESVVAPEVLPPAREVTFATADGVTISATFRAASVPEAPAVILVHQLSSTRAEWQPLLDRLRAQPALTTLAIDMRGHGESTRGPAGALDWHSFDTAQWVATRLDVLAAVAFLASAESGVHPASIAGVGSSIGSTAVVAAAAEDPRLRPLVTLSPGRAYHGFDAITPALALHDCPILAVVAYTETDSVDTAQTFARLTHVPAYVADGPGHGVVLFSTMPSTLDHVEDFLRTQLREPRLVPRVPGAERAGPPVTSAGTPAP